jgi:hypothetical protein
MSSVYRRPGGPLSPIEDGEYEDLPRMVQAVERAARHLGEPVLSADEPKSFRVGFVVGTYHWSIRSKLAGRTCPEELKGHLGTQAGRIQLARLMTERAGVWT